MGINQEVLLILENDIASYRHPYLRYKSLSEWLHKYSKLYSALLFVQEIALCIVAYNAGNTQSGVANFRYLLKNVWRR